MWSCGLMLLSGGYGSGGTQGDRARITTPHFDYAHFFCLDTPPTPTPDADDVDDVDAADRVAPRAQHTKTTASALQRSTTVLMFSFVFVSLHRPHSEPVKRAFNRVARSSRGRSFLFVPGDHDGPPLAVDTVEDYRRVLS